MYKVDSPQYSPTTVNRKLCRRRVSCSSRRQVGRAARTETQWRRGACVSSLVRKKNLCPPAHALCELQTTACWAVSCAIHRACRLALAYTTVQPVMHMNTPMRCNVYVNAHTKSCLPTKIVSFTRILCSVGPSGSFRFENHPMHPADPKPVRHPRNKPTPPWPLKDYH